MKYLLAVNGYALATIDIVNPIKVIENDGNIHLDLESNETSMQVAFLVVEDDSKKDIPEPIIYKTIVFGAGLDYYTEKKLDYEEPVLYLHVGHIDKVPTDKIETANHVREVIEGGNVIVHKDRYGLFKDGFKL